jgi:hypothetical protein
MDAYWPFLVTGAVMIAVGVVDWLLVKTGIFRFNPDRRYRRIYWLFSPATFSRSRDADIEGDYYTPEYPPGSLDFPVRRIPSLDEARKAWNKYHVFLRILYGFLGLSFIIAAIFI